MFIQKRLPSSLVLVFNIKEFFFLEQFQNEYSYSLRFAPEIIQEYDKEGSSFSIK